MRAFTELWDELCRERYGVADPRLRQFRYGVQVNSLGLTEQQPERTTRGDPDRGALMDASNEGCGGQVDFTDLAVF